MPASASGGSSGAETALRGRDAERAHLAGLDQRIGRRQIGEQHLDVPRDNVVERRQRSAIGHMGHLDSELGIEQLAEVVERPDPAEP